MRAIEEGVRYGWNRAHKHTDKPDEDAIFQEIENGIANALSEIIDFEELN